MATPNVECRDHRPITPRRNTTTSPCRAQRSEHGFGGGRRRAAAEGCEHRRVPPPRFVEQRGGSCGERGIRTLGRLLTYVRLASGYLRPLGHLSKRFSEAREGENVAAGGLGSSEIGVARESAEFRGLFVVCGPRSALRGGRSVPVGVAELVHSCGGRLARHADARRLLSRALGPGGGLPVR
jgi:hypothetical protein